MMHNKSSFSISGGIGLLTIAFVVLKLCNVISWSWFWVLSPLIFSFLFIIGIIFLIGAWKM